MFSDENADILSPPDTIKALKEMIAADTSSTARMHVTRFGNFNLELIKYIKGEESNIIRWFKVAGNAYTTVDIYDDTGNTLFVVPPILIRTDTTAADAAVSDVMREYTQLLSSSPIAATNYLRNQFSYHKSNHIEHANSHKVLWNKLLAYYGEPEIFDTKATSTSNSTLASMITDDDEEEMI